MFTYDSAQDLGVTRTAIGILHSWAELSVEFDRQGPACPAINVLHFKTISPLGPKLFAVSLDTFNVFYHLDDQWHQYQSARNVRLGTLEDLIKFFNNDDDNDNEDSSHEDNDGNDQDDYHSRQVKDSTSNNYSKYQINHALVYNLLLQMFLFIRLQFYRNQYQSLTD
jgi:hypothetical protein